MDVDADELVPDGTFLFFVSHIHLLDLSSFLLFILLFRFFRIVSTVAEPIIQFYGFVCSQRRMDISPPSYPLHLICDPHWKFSWSFRVSPALSVWKYPRSEGHCAAPCSSRARHRQVPFLQQFKGRTCETTAVIYPYFLWECRHQDDDRQGTSVDFMPRTPTGNRQSSYPTVVVNDNSSQHIACRESKVA